MRYRLLALVLLGVAASAEAQTREPGPFVTAEVSARSTVRNDAVGTTVGFEATFGGPSWKGFQLLGQGGRILDLTPDRRQAGSPIQLTAWYGAGGIRYSTPRLWKFRPYVEETVGVARIESLLIDPPSMTTVLRSHAMAPLVSTAFGVQLPVWKSLTLDFGARSQLYFGDATATLFEPYIAIGLSF